MRILGIDPGLKITGYGCVDAPSIDGAITGEPVLVEAGVVRLDPRAPIGDRLDELYGSLIDLIEELRPRRMVVEQLFSHYKHVRTSIIMGHARGVVLLAARRRDVELGELAPTEVKKAVTGRGHASKRQVQLAVMSQLALAAPPEPPDVSDAIAIALCAARRGAGDAAPAT